MAIVENVMSNRINLKNCSGITIGIAVILTVGIFMGCAGSHVAEPMTPNWTSQSSGAYHAPEDAFFQGVGSAENMRQTSLLRASADNHATAQLAGLIDQYLKALFQFSGFSNPSIETQQTLGAITRQALDHAEISDHWYDEASGKLFARCILGLEDLKQILSASSLPDSIRSAMADRAAQVFEAFVPRTK
jgi:hypothetical protein